MSDTNKTQVTHTPAEITPECSPCGSTEKLSLNYILEQIEKIVLQTEHISNTIQKLGEMANAECPGDVVGQAKAQALGDVVRCRETTNQQLLRFYEKMYDDLKSKNQSPNVVADRFQQMMDLLKSINWDEYPKSSRTLIEQAITAQLLKTTN